MYLHLSRIRQHDRERILLMFNSDSCHPAFRPALNASALVELHDPINFTASRLGHIGLTNQVRSLLRRTVSISKGTTPSILKLTFQSRSHGGMAGQELWKTGPSRP